MYLKPSPISYVLESIDGVLVKHLGNTQDKRIDNLKKALTKYCPYLQSKGLIANCGAVAAQVDRKPVNNKCRLCANKCGEGYTEEGGTIVGNRENYQHEFKEFGEGCTEDYGSFTRNNFKLCC